MGLDEPQDDDPTSRVDGVEANVHTLQVLHDCLRRYRAEDHVRPEPEGWTANHAVYESTWLDDGCVLVSEAPRLKAMGVPKVIGERHPTGAFNFSIHHRLLGLPMDLPIPKVGEFVEASLGVLDNLTWDDLQQPYWYLPPIRTRTLFWGWQR